MKRRSQQMIGVKDANNKSLEMERESEQEKEKERTENPATVIHCCRQTFFAKTTLSVFRFWLKNSTSTHSSNIYA